MLNFARAVVIILIALGWLLTTILAESMQDIPTSVIFAVAALFGEKGLELVKGFGGKK